MLEEMKTETWEVYNKDPTMIRIGFEVIVVDFAPSRTTMVSEYEREKLVEFIVNAVNEQNKASKQCSPPQA